MNDELGNVKKLYELALASATSPPPKRGFLSSKCPACGAKLKKKSVAHPVFAGEGAEGFATQVVNDHELAPGFYSLTIDSFTCDCGYVFAERQLDKVEPES